MSDEFKKLELRPNEKLLPCPFCGSEAELWEMQVHESFQKSVCCTKSSEDGEGDCLMYLPGDAAWKSTRGQAIKQWNQRKGE